MQVIIMIYLRVSGGEERAGKSKRRPLAVFGLTCVSRSILKPVSNHSHEPF